MSWLPKTRMERQEWRNFFVFISPWLFGLICLAMFPLIWGGWISMTNYTGFNIRNLKFVGFANYVRAFNDPKTIHGITRTLYITMIAVPLNIIGGFMLALLLNQKIKGQGIFRVLFYLPSIIPITAVALIWGQLLSKNAGLINLIIDIFTPAEGTTINWLFDYSNESLIMLFVWGLGGGMVIYLAGLQNIPSELKEAAHVDGATPVQSFFNVTLPLMTPVLLFQTIMGLIWSLQILVPALLLAPTTDARSVGLTIPRDNRLFMVHLYEQAFIYNRFGYALALAWILFVVVLIMAIVVLKTSSYWVYYESGVEE
jgi:ABC-type sugar transport system permease subunit